MNNDLLFMDHSFFAQKQKYKLFKIFGRDSIILVERNIRNSSYSEKRGILKPINDSLFVIEFKSSIDAGHINPNQIGIAFMLEYLFQNLRK